MTQEEYDQAADAVMEAAKLLQETLRVVRLRGICVTLSLETRLLPGPLGGAECHLGVEVEGPGDILTARELGAAKQRFDA